MNVQWTSAAIAQLTHLHAWVAATSPNYALRVVDRLTKVSKTLGDTPMTGDPVPQAEDDGVREIVEGPFRLIYVVKVDGVNVLAVLLGGNDFPWREDMP